MEQKQEVMIVVGGRGNIAKIIIATAFQGLCQHEARHFTYVLLLNPTTRRFSYALFWMRTPRLRKN